jgi:Skp family chaperone for outer membrane proteins
MTRLLTIVLALAFSGAATAQAYKWTDSNGRVQYGDTPPGDATNVTRLRGPTSGSASAPEATKDAAGKDKPLTPEQAFKKRQQEREEADQKAGQERAQAEQKRANCEQARASLRQLESGQRVSTVNAAGERVFLDDDQRASSLARAQKSVAEWCK